MDAVTLFTMRSQGKKIDLTPFYFISQSAASGATAGFGGAFAAIVGTASCASCLAFLFGFVGLGIGSVAFVLKYQTFFLFGATALVLFSLYFTARKINRACNSC